MKTWNMVSTESDRYSVRGVQNVENFIEMNDAIERMDSIAKSESLVYSIGDAIFLRLKHLPRLRGSSPFLGTSSFVLNSLALSHSQTQVHLFATRASTMGLAKSNSSSLTVCGIPGYLRSITFAPRPESTSAESFTRCHGI